jgi:hypothetical protein
LESIKIAFLEPKSESPADGLRRLTVESWAGVCLVLSRGRLHAALKTGHLTHPGVYILVGPSEISAGHNGRTLVFELYIGRSDSFDERIARHDKFKNFWSTAFFFYRDGVDELHAGQTGDLEARLIAKAKAAGNKVNHVHNVANPKPQGGSDSTEMFLKQIETILKALGYDFFSPQQLTEAAVLEPLEVADEPQMDVPESLRALIGQIRAACLALPSTEFYATHVPDLRAKVVSAHGSRIFARVQFKKRAVKLTLRGQAFTLEADALVDESVKEKIKDAYSHASQQLAD